MKYSAAAVLLAATAAVALPAKRAISDTDILQYALTLEHLEDYFYHNFLDQFDQAAFMAAGYPDWVRNRVENIAQHEAQHVALLSGALGSAATQPCTYAFPGVTDPVSFMATATLIENVGVSAYLGAASSITEAAYVTVAGSILTTEARHQGWFSSSVDMGPGWSGPEDTPLDFSEVYSIASAFITSCPSSNPTLPVQAFPALSIAADGTITTTASTDGTYVQVIAGLITDTFPVSGGKVANLPAPQGISYAVLTTQSNTTLVSDENIVAGPFIMNNPFLSKFANPAPSF
ncbi:ferritin-like domain-domain-containing protein [Naematelia encephala]|uniref:Ferritin-like domain-domain-containing protein n=1 Tax=Naematelia encephala TaxID=71784 RepID=A0A1Y2B1E9_9TREE|nr:ferritin-like domain-domain-containing protein [Naematelia encephala]